MDHRHFVHFVLLLGLIAGMLPAQQHTHISGLIRDPSGAAVPSASVSVVNSDTGFRRVTRSRSNGGYVVASLQPGLYKITIRKEGFRTLIRYDVKLDAAQPVQLDFTLVLGSVREVVTVSGSSPRVNTDDASVGTLIHRDRIEKLPLNGRGLLSLLEFAPGTVVTPATRGEAGQFTVSGQRPNANYFTVDGVSANNGVSGGGHPAQSTGGSLPGMTALGSLHGLISLEALNEFRVQTSSATPEFGKLPGAQVVLSSRSGSNEFHGSLFSYFRTGRIDANDWFANSGESNADPLRMNDFGASVGGPLKRNRAFFFLSYEGMRLREPFAWHAPVPTAETRAEAPEWTQRVLDLYPLPNGRALGSGLAEWRGQNNRNGRFDVFSARIDAAVTSRVTVFARYNRAWSTNEFTSTQRNDLAIDLDSITAGASLRLGPRAVLDVKFNRSDANGESAWRLPAGLSGSPCYFAPVSQVQFNDNRACDSLVRFSIAGLGPIVVGPEADQRQRQWHLLPAGTFVFGGHQFKVGMDYRSYAPERRDHLSTLSLIAEDFDDLIRQRNLWWGNADRLNLTSNLTEYSAFAQDTWRIHPRLTATVGLRWEYSRSPQLFEPDGSAANAVPHTFVGQTSIWTGNQNNFAPRVGIAFQPTGDGKTVLRGGWGRFFDSTLSIATDLVNGGPLSISQLLANQGFVSAQLRYGFLPDLRLPQVQQWNVTFERHTVANDVFSVGYVGSSGRDLLRREFGVGFDDNPRLWLALATNHGEADYHGLQVQYRRPMSRGVQALASYSWSHSIDNSSSDSVLNRVGDGLTAQQDRGASDFDVRHALTFSLTYERERKPGPSWSNRLFGGWGIDAIFRARSGFPIAVLNSEYAMGLGFSNAFRPNMVPGEPIWLSDPSAPGGKRLNRSAFQTTSGDVQGNLGRNAIRGFGMHQFDLALRREFRFDEKRSLQLRAEAFNLLNHPNFADPTRFLSSPLFGESPSMLNLMLGTGSPGSGLTPVFQNGGARSVQLILRFRF